MQKLTINQPAIVKTAIAFTLSTSTGGTVPYLKVHNNVGSNSASNDIVPVHIPIKQIPYKLKQRSTNTLNGSATLPQNVREGTYRNKKTIPGTVRYRIYQKNLTLNGGPVFGSPLFRLAVSPSLSLLSP
jgi:hypothetical protein